MEHNPRHDYPPNLPSEPSPQPKSIGSLITSYTKAAFHKPKYSWFDCNCALCASGDE